MRGSATTITKNKGIDNVKYYKLAPLIKAQQYEITTKQSFENATKNKYPYVQKNNSGGLSYYAFCPICLNPIQLVGLYTSNRKYGKHTGEDIKGLGKFNFYYYRYCPYATNQRVHIDPRERLTDIDDRIKELYYLIKEQFDRIIYIVEKTLNIKCSKQFWENSLNQFMMSEGYLYPWINEANIPYVFAYLGLQSQNLYGQMIKNNSALYNKLHSSAELSIVDQGNGYSKITSKEGCYVLLTVRFLNHIQKALEGEELNETIQFCVDKNNNDFFSETIQIDNHYFINLINKIDNNNKRNTKLLQLSEKHMPNI